LGRAGGGAVADGFQRRAATVGYRLPTYKNAGALKVRFPKEEVFIRIEPSGFFATKLVS